MKRYFPLLAVAAILLLGTAVYLGVHVIAAPTLSAKESSSEIHCSQTGSKHQVIIRNGSASPAHTEAKLCDNLTIVNADNQIRLVAFGVHDSHKSYNGMVERALQKGQSMSITLDQSGTFRFHDHLQDQAQGTFTVDR